MHMLVGALGGLLVLLMLAEFFLSFLLPRRVKHDPRVVRGLIIAMWGPWGAIARRLRTPAADTLLGFFGPLALLAMVAAWSAGLVLGFAGLHWAVGSQLHATAQHTNFGDDLYFSGSSFFNVSTALAPHNSGAQVLRIAEAATGYAVLFVVIGYLPALFQAFSRREVAVSQLDARAGSPPSASRLLMRSGNLGGWSDLDAYLADWEGWAAELMETHLSYPILGYYRSQHVNQNWLAALITVLDAAAFAIAAAPAATPAAELTFAIGRHALADLSGSYGARPLCDSTDRLGEEDFARLCAIAAEASLSLAEPAEARATLDELRAMYEPYALALAERLMLPLPLWISDGEHENWRLSAWRSRRAGVMH